MLASQVARASAKGRS